MTTRRPSKVTWGGGWRPDAHSIAEFARLGAGSVITVVKRAPDGRETTRYPATVAQSNAPAPWIEVVATWGHGRIEVGGLAFEPGDALREFFSAEHPYNAFAVISPDRQFRGWYGNVTYPAFLDIVDNDVVLVWHDLYLDVVILPDGTTHLLDDDELDESPIPRDDPDFAEAIIQARRDLIDTIPMLIQNQAPPGSQLYAHPAGR